MRTSHRLATVLVSVLAAGLGLAAPSAARADAFAGADAGPAPADAPPPEDEQQGPKAGEFDAGGQVRLPNGPDEMGQYATFNWIALDVKGRYVLLDFLQLHGTFPLAVKTPDLVGGIEPRLIGGAVFTLEAKVPEPPIKVTSQETEAALLLGGTYLRRGAALLSEKDYPLFHGDFALGFNAGLRARVKLGDVTDFVMAPVFVYQGGEPDALMGVQLPTSFVLKIGSLVALAADLGIYTGDGFTFRGSKGGRIAAGGALDVKVGPIIVHAGAGAASLLTGGAYPTITDSFYVDLNVKFAK